MNDNDDIEDKDDGSADARPEILKRLHKWERASKEQHSKWRENAKKWYDLVSGEQWSADEKAALMEQMRQPITFNRVGPMVDAVAGAEVLNRQAVSFYPRELGDAKANEVYTAAADYVRDNCDAEDEESDAFLDTITCGMGWTETHMSYEDDPAGDILIPRIDPLEMGWDPNAKKRNITDSRFRFRVRHYEKGDFKARWPEKYDAVLAADQGDLDQSADDGYSSPRDDYTWGRDDKRQANDNRLAVVQMQWWDLEKGFAVPNAQGDLEAVSSEQYKALVNMALMNGAQPPQAVKHDRRVHYQAIYSGNVLIEKKELPSGFTFQCITGKRDRNTNTWYGIVKAMYDPQMWANKWLSQLLHIINSNAKGGLMYETGSFVNKGEAEDQWSRPDSMIEMKPGMLDRVREKQPPAMPQGMTQLLEFATESLPQVSGINLEMLGLVQREQAGVLEASRKKSGYAILAVFFDSLRRYRKLQGRVLLDHINRYVSDGRLIRITGEKGVSQYIPLIRQPGVAKFDVVVDEAPMNADQKQMVWGMLTQMLPMLKDAPIGMDVWAKFVEYSPLPSSLAQEIIEGLSQGPTPEQQQAQQLDQQRKGMEVRKIAADASYSEARAAKAGAETQKTSADTQKTMIEAQRAMIEPIQYPQAARF